MRLVTLVIGCVMLLVTVGTILKLVFDGIGRRDICPYLPGLLSPEPDTLSAR